MNGLFDNLQEWKEERLAIMAGEPAESIAADIHRCEVRTIVNRYFPDGDPKPFFAEVEKRRGKVAADILRADCREEWQRRKSA